MPGLPSLYTLLLSSWLCFIGSEHNPHLGPPFTFPIRFVLRVTCKEWRVASHARLKIRCRRPLAILLHTSSSPNHEPRLISAFNTSTLIIFIFFSLRLLEINEFVVLIQTFSSRSKFSIVLLGGVEICKNVSSSFLSSAKRTTFRTVGSFGSRSIRI